MALYSIIKRHGPRNAVGFVASRSLEAAMIFGGVISVLGVYTLRQDLGGTDAVGLTTTTDALIAIKDWTFLLGPGLMAVVNALFLATVLRRAQLVPRIIPTIGLVGAPLLLASFLATLFGAFDQVSGQALILALPIAIWEFSLGVWLTVKGVKTSGAGEVADEQPIASTVPVAYAPVA